MKQTVYIETSVISYYASLISNNLITAAHQKITHDWWENALPKLDGFISPFIIDEISQGDKDAIKRRLEAILPFSVLTVNQEIIALANEYFFHIGLPEKARFDSYHLAMATWHDIDFLVSWNCAHIVSAKIRIAVELINDKRGIKTPLICTPEELMEV